mgnify:CR=1 FL=1
MRLVARTTKDPITAIIDTIPRDDHINPQTPLLTNPHGKKTINHTGQRPAPNSLARV